MALDGCHNGPHILLQFFIVKRELPNAHAHVPQFVHSIRSACDVFSNHANHIFAHSASFYTWCFWAQLSTKFLYGGQHLRCNQEDVKLKSTKAKIRSTKCQQPAGICTGSGRSWCFLYLNLPCPNRLDYLRRSDDCSTGIHSVLRYILVLFRELARPIITCWLARHIHTYIYKDIKS